MARGLLPALVVVALAAVALSRAPHRRTVHLPAGVIELHSEMPVDGGTELCGAPSGTTLHLAPDFAGRAAIVVKSSGVTLRDFSVDGNRERLDKPAGLAPYDTPFARFTRNSGVLADGINSLRIENLRFRDMSGFAILVSRSHHVTIDRVAVNSSGGRNAAGRNNATGGILLEEGTTDFAVTRCRLEDILGNGIWTHSLYTSPRNARGLVAMNQLARVGRDALQVGHAIDVRVEQNSAARIGFPEAAVDIENRAIPVALDTAGNVESASYSYNRFEEIDGKCMDLDGFHDGEIRGNVCVNRGPAGSYRFGNYGIVMNNSNPDMQSRNIRVVENTVDGTLFGGIFVIGTGHLIARNRFVNLNLAHCNENAAEFGCYFAAGEPNMLRTGIYLGRGAERPSPARDNVIEDNEISGFQMATRCWAIAPGILPWWNTVRGNRCRDE